MARYRMAAGTTQTLETKVADLITASLSAMGYDLVRVMLSGKGDAATMQIMAERADGKPMLVDDCAAISVAVSEKIDADPTLADAFALEVSSPGIDRPLMKMQDYTRFAGHLAQVELTENLDGRRRFKATIVKADATTNDIEFTADKKVFTVPCASIAKAKLVITDKLLKEAAAS